MRPIQQSFICIEEAIAKLGYPKAIWYRGHSAGHRLLPSLFRFRHGVENERHITKRYAWNAAAPHIKNTCYNSKILVSMYNSYMPTRLLEWTSNLNVALFCALVRESDKPTVFILNPFALNAYSKKGSIIKSNSDPQSDRDILSWSNGLLLPKHPVAIISCTNDSEKVKSDTMFTLHGTIESPLEEQCPDCVCKAMLSDNEVLLAEEFILSGKCSEHYPL